MRIFNESHNYHQPADFLLSDGGIPGAAYSYPDTSDTSDLVTADGKHRIHPFHTAIPPLFCMNPGMAVSAEGDQVVRKIIRRIMIPVVHVEAVIGSADHAPVPVAFSCRVPGRSPGPESVLGPGTDGSPEPGAEKGVPAAFREGTGVAERPEPVGVRPVPAERSGGPVECRERKLTFRIHTTPKNGPGGIRTPDIRVRSPALYPG